MKPRSDSKLKNLSPERQEQLMEWVNTPKTEATPGGLQFAKEQLEADGITVSMRAISEFVSWWRLEHRFSSAAERAQQFEKTLLENPDFSPERAREAGQALFTMEAMSSGDVQSFVALERLNLDQKTAKTRAELERDKLEISRRRIALLEANASSAKEKLESLTHGGGLTPEVLKTIEDAARLL